jgi:hypothetical protein
MNEENAFSSRIFSEKSSRIKIVHQKSPLHHPGRYSAFKNQIIPHIFIRSKPREKKINAGQKLQKSVLRKRRRDVVGSEDKDHIGHTQSGNENQHGTTRIFAEKHFPEGKDTENQNAKCPGSLR